jgi:uncharacterized Zn ribbon protein
MVNFPCNQCWNDEILCIGQPNVCSKVEEIKAWHEELEKWRDEAAVEVEAHRDSNGNYWIDGDDVKKLSGHIETDSSVTVRVFKAER